MKTMIQEATRTFAAGLILLGATVGSKAAADGKAETGAAAPWPPPIKSPAGAPNVVLILLDDVGYSWSSVFGGPVSTPNIDSLAARGLKYSNFHVNSLCSPTRAALLSGRNAHEIGFGTITESANRQPGYTSIWPKNAVSLAEVLRRNGYSTAAFGKWHNTPTWEVNPAGSFEHWPTSLGFEYFYGFLGAATTQYDPVLYENTRPVPLPKTPEAGYLLNPDLVDHAQNWVHQHDASAPGRPFFLYFATGAIHAPHHVPRDWIARFKGRFDQGWDKQREETFAREKALGVLPDGTALTPRPKELPAWDSLGAEEKKLYAAQAELYAAYLAETDFEVGRLLDDLKAAGHVNDTAVLLIVGDNGASGEGGLEGTIGYKATVQEQLAHLDEFGSRDLANHVESAWAWAANAPFQWMKQIASHLGGTTDPLIVSWPGHIKDMGAFRRQFSFVTDIAPTIYELAHIQFPGTVDGVEQLPLEGASLAFSFDDPQAASRHNRQYFEMVGNRGIYEDGWWAGSRQGVPWERGDRGEPLPWELYHLADDFSQAHNLAAEQPQKLKELQDLYAAEAERNHVYPKGGSGRGGIGPLTNAEPPSLQSSWTFRSGVQRIPARYAPRLSGKSYRITAEVEVGQDTPNGVIFTQGGRKGGITLYVQDGRAVFELAPVSNTPATAAHTRVTSSEPLGPGKSTIEIVATRSGDASAAAGGDSATPSLVTPENEASQTFDIVLQVNGKSQGVGKFETGEFHGAAFGGAARNPVGSALSIGGNPSAPVSPEAAATQPFNAKIQAVTFAVLKAESGENKSNRQASNP
jgi:arylsulfatase